MEILRLLFLILTYCPHIAAVFAAYALFEINTIAGASASIAITLLPMYEVDTYVNRPIRPLCDLEVDRMSA